MECFTRLAAALSLVSLSACQSTPPVEPADIILINGGIYTVDSARSWAQAAAIRDGGIIAVGENDDVTRYQGNATRTIDLQGKMALPGFHDSHIHPLEGGYLMQSCDLTEVVADVQSLLRAIRECVSRTDAEWIIGIGFDLSLFGANGPDKSLLDDIAPDRLFFIDAEDGHSAWVNSRTLALAGFDADTADPEHGVIERRAGSHEPNGTLRETARDIVDKLRPRRELNESIRVMGKAVRAMNAVGITSAIDAWAGELELQAYHALDQSGSLSLRVVNSIIDEGVFSKHSGADFERLIAARQQYASDLINNDSIKIMLDGVFEGETAALTQPYTDLDHSGTLNHTADELRARVARYDAMGLQVHMHAIGDGAVRAGLDAIEYARKQNPDPAASRDLRHHLAHLGLIDKADILRFGELNVAANFTAAWAYPSKWALELNVPVLGQERVDQFYPLNSVHAAGGVIVGGSDWIYGPIDPLESIEVAITRKDPHNSGGPAGNTADSVDLATIIDAYTINGAWLMHQERKTGSIETGKRADIVVLDRNLFEIPSTQINEAKVALTLFNGRIVYDRNRIKEAP